MTNKDKKKIENQPKNHGKMEKQLKKISELKGKELLISDDVNGNARIDIIDIKMLDDEMIFVGNIWQYITMRFDQLLDLVWEGKTQWSKCVTLSIQ